MTVHDERQAKALIATGLETLELDPRKLPILPKNDWRKLLLAELIRSHTTQTLDWISQCLFTRTVGYTSRRVGQWKRSLSEHPERRKLRTEILEKARGNT